SGARKDQPGLERFLAQLLRAESMNVDLRLGKPFKNPVTVGHQLLQARETSPELLGALDVAVCGEVRDDPDPVPQLALLYGAAIVREVEHEAGTLDQLEVRQSPRCRNGSSEERRLIELPGIRQLRCQAAAARAPCFKEVHQMIREPTSQPVALVKE